MRRCCAVRAVLTIALGAGLVAAPGAEAVDFSDRDLLTETLTLDEQEPLAEAEAELAVADAELQVAREAELEAAEAARVARMALEAADQELADALAEDPQDPDRVAAAEADQMEKAEADRIASAAALRTAEEADAKQGVFDDKLAAVEAIETEIARTEELVGQLSEKQVHDLNAALHDARQTGLLPLDLDAEHLQAILDDGYGTREIHALTKAYEQEARFERIASRFLERYEATGREQFLRQAERFEARGDAHYEKFLGKVDRFVEQADRQEAREAAREAAAEERVDNGRHLAKGHAH